MKSKYLAIGCGLFAMTFAAPAAAQDYAVFSANLFGKETAGGGPAKDASADFNGEADMESGQLCYFFEAFGLSDITGAALVKGGKSGSPAVSLQVGAAGSDEVCADVAADALSAIIKKPGGFTVVIYTSEFPDGALSAKLAD